MAYAILLLDLLVFVGICHGVSVTYNMEVFSLPNRPTCPTLLSQNVGNDDVMTVKARSSIFATIAGASTCQITFKSSSSTRPRLEVSFSSAGWSCTDGGSDTHLYLYDGQTDKSTELKKFRCSQSYLSTVSPDSVYSSGRYLTVKLKRSSRFKINYDFSLSIQPTGTTYSDIHNTITSTVSTIGSVIGAVIGSIVFVIVVVVVVIVWRLSVRRRNLQTRTIVTQGVGSPQVLTAMSGTQYPPPGAQYPPPGTQYPPPGAQYPPPGTQYSPPGAQYLPPGTQYPQQPQESPATNTGVDMDPPPYKQ